MASAVLTTFNSTSGAVVGDIANAILKSSDWARIQRSGDVNTTLSATILAGVSAFTSALTIPAGSIISLSGTETVQSTAVSGAGPFTITLAGPTKLGHTSGDAVATGSLFGATTTRGAQLRVDIADSLPSANSYKYMSLGVYRTHDGTTAVDKITRYVIWRTTNAGVAAEVTHCDVSVSKEHIFIGVTGALPGENSTATLDSTTNGQGRWGFYLGDVVPYNVSDTVPCVACAGLISPTVTDTVMSVSRDRANTVSWASARLASIQPVFGLNVLSSAVGVVVATSLKLKNSSDGTNQLLPYSVWELTDGLRGRLNGIYYQGLYSSGGSAVATDEAPPVGLVIGPVSGVTYTTVELVRGTITNATGNALGIVMGNGGVGYIVGAVASG